MKFDLSKKSIERLNEVHEKLIEVVHYAIKYTEVDFAVSEGLRTLEKQKIFFEQGKSETMNSKHLTGHAVDLVAFVEGHISWEWPLYFKIAEAMRLGAQKALVKIRWGGTWDFCPDIANWKGTMKEAHLGYIKWKKEKGESYFPDGPHFELN